MSPCGPLSCRHQLRAGQLQDGAVPQAAASVPPGLRLPALPQQQGPAAGPPAVPVQVSPGPGPWVAPLPGSRLARGSALGSGPSAPFTLPGGPMVQGCQPSRCPHGGRCGQGVAPLFPCPPMACAPSGEGVCWCGPALARLGVPAPTARFTLSGGLTFSACGFGPHLRSCTWSVLISSWAISSSLQLCLPWCPTHPWVCQPATQAQYWAGWAWGRRTPRGVWASGPSAAPPVGPQLCVQLVPWAKSHSPVI